MAPLKIKIIYIFSGAESWIPDAFLLYPQIPDATSIPSCIVPEFKQKAEFNWIDSTGVKALVLYVANPD